jgi:hypothetical protein
VPDGSAVDLIPIADQVARGLIPRECLRDLTCDPVCGRMRSDVDPDEVSWLFKIQALREIPRRALASQRIPPDNRILSAPSYGISSPALFKGAHYPILPRASSPHHAVKARAPTRRKSPSKSAIPEVVRM